MVKLKKKKTTYSHVVLVLGRMVKRNNDEKKDVQANCGSVGTGISSHDRSMITFPGGLSMIEHGNEVDCCSSGGIKLISKL